MKILIIWTDSFGDFIFKTDKDISESDLTEENGRLKDEIIELVIKKYNMDADFYEVLKTDEFNIFISDIQNFPEFWFTRGILDTWSIFLFFDKYKNSKTSSK